ncbi:MAG: hypothetical protein ACOY9D_08370 [Pseudomonadota bacterium]
MSNQQKSSRKGSASNNSSGLFEMKNQRIKNDAEPCKILLVLLLPIGHRLAVHCDQPETRDTKFFGLTQTFISCSTGGIKPAPVNSH